MAVEPPAETYRSPEEWLGTRESVHESAFRGGKLATWALRTVAFLAAAAFALRANPIAIGPWILFAVAGLHVVIGADAYRRRHDAVHVHGEGLRLFRDGAWRAYRWEALAAYEPKVDRVGGGSIWLMNWWRDVARFRIVVTTKEGERVVLTSATERVLRVGSRIREETLKRLVPDVEAKLAKGERVDFGTMALAAEGVVRVGSTLPWEELASVKVERGVIEIRKKGALFTWSKARYTETRNPHVLVEILERRARAANAA